MIDEIELITIEFTVGRSFAVTTWLLFQLKQLGFKCIYQTRNQVSKSKFAGKQLQRAAYILTADASNSSSELTVCIICFFRFETKTPIFIRRKFEKWKNSDTSIGNKLFISNNKLSIQGTTSYEVYRIQDRRCLPKMSAIIWTSRMSQLHDSLKPFLVWQLTLPSLRLPLRAALVIILSKPDSAISRIRYV